MRKLLWQEVAILTSKLRTQQQNKCAICGHHFTVSDGSVLDHDHDTGLVRGVIHRSCNGAEGKVKTQAKRSHKGVKPADFVVQLGKYLEHHKVPRVHYIHPTHKSEQEKRLERNAKARKRRAANKVGK